MAGQRRMARIRNIAPPLRPGKRKSLRDQLRERDGVRCFYCGTPLYFNSHPWQPNEIPASMAATIEHLVPRSLGGTNDLDNLVLACYLHNTLRGNHRLINVPFVLDASMHWNGSWDVQVALARAERLSHMPPKPVRIPGPPPPPPPLCPMHPAGDCALARYKARHCIDAPGAALYAQQLTQTDL